MSFDLGLDHENEDPAYIQSAIQQLEQTYHLVLLTDYFEESLILLKVKNAPCFRTTSVPRVAQGLKFLYGQF